MPPRKKTIQPLQEPEPLPLLEDDIYGDVGNKQVKGVFGDVEVNMPHALIELTEAQFNDQQERFGQDLNKDFVRVNNKPYVVGTAAESYAFTPRIGRAKYTRDYYGVQLAVLIARLAEGYNNFGVNVFASHATDDFKFRKEIRDAVLGPWAVQCGYTTTTFTIEKATTYDEPLGSYMWRSVTPDGLNQVSTYVGAATVVLDIGGGTINLLYIADTGAVDYIRSTTVTTGVEDAMVRLRGELERKYRDFFTNKRNIAPDRLRKALESGIYRGGGEELPCEDLVEWALNPLINQVLNAWNTRAEGGGAVDRVILTGGGSALIGERVKPFLKFPDKNTEYADDLKSIHMANVRGARTFARMVRAYRQV
jgi:hypothetical protein